MVRKKYAHQILRIDFFIVTQPGIHKCALWLFHSFTNETTKIIFQFLSFISRYNAHHGKCDNNCTYFAFSSIKMSTHGYVTYEYVSKVGKNVVSGQSSVFRVFRPGGCSHLFDQVFIKTKGSNCFKRDYNSHALFCRIFPFHSKKGAAIHCTRIQIKQQQQQHKNKH